jgi:hypothetical protein
MNVHELYRYLIYCRKRRENDKWSIETIPKEVFDITYLIFDRPFLPFHIRNKDEVVTTKMYLDTLIDK